MILLPATSRRRLITGLAVAFVTSGGGALAAKQSKKQEQEVGAVEDLMREHGVLRRALLVYRESAAKLRAGNALDPEPIQQTAQVFRTFGEDYHERQLEEAYIFPALRKAESPAGALVDVLIQQHNRGREITEYILAVTGKGTIGGNDTEALARELLVIHDELAEQLDLLDLIVGRRGQPLHRLSLDLVDLGLDLRDLPQCLG
jgi:hemerythrin-like domain-containing protein